MIATSRQSLKQLLPISTVTALCIGSIVVLQLPLLKNLSNKSQTASVADINKELAVKKNRLAVLKRLPTFGFRNIIADYAFINFAPYFGDDEARAKTGYGLSPEYFEVIIDRDPYFLDAYRFLSSSTTLYAGMPEKTVALMEKGLKYLSPQVPKNSYYIWRYKGTDELLFLGDSQAARQSFETAGKWADTYSDKDSKYIAQLSYQTAQFLAKNPNSKSAQVGAWSIVLGNASDNRLRNIAISRIRALGGTVTITPDGQAKVERPKKD